jgi:zinc transport system substrate-binding protein
MISFFRNSIFILFSFFSLLITSSCEKKTPPLPQKPLVLVTLSPYQTFVQKIAGDTVAIRPVIPFRANPHTYEPTLKELQALDGATLWFFLSEPFEVKLLPVFQEKKPLLSCINLCQNLPLMPISPCVHSSAFPLHPHSLDRHIWLSPKMVQTQAKTIAKALIVKFPENRELYQKNLESFLVELKELDEKIASILDMKIRKTIAISHGALGYFCKDYNIEQIPLEEDGKDLLIKELYSRMEKVHSSGISKIYIQKEHNNQCAFVLSEKLHLPLEMIDLFVPDYFENMIHIAKSIRMANKEIYVDHPSR